MRIDAHAHGDPGSLTGDPREYVDACREHGLDGIVLIESLQTCVSAVAKFGDFIIPVAMVSMDHVGAREVEECIREGCRGVKFICPDAPYGDERYWPLYEKLEELDAVAVFHTGYLAFLPKRTGERPDSPVSMEHMRAAQIERISRRFPHLKILMAHFSNPWWEEAWKVSWTKENVYADLSGGTAIHRSTNMWAEMFAPDGKVQESSVRKLCFGADVTYFRDGEFPFEPYISFYERIFDRVELSPDLREVVNSGNVQSLFGLER